MKIFFLALLFGSTLQAAQLTEGFYGTQEQTDLASSSTKTMVKRLMPHPVQGAVVKWLDPSHTVLSFKWVNDPFTGVNYGLSNETIYRCFENICIDSKNKAIELISPEVFTIAITYGYERNYQTKLFTYSFVGKTNPGENAFYIQGEGISSYSNSAKAASKLRTEAQAKKVCSNKGNLQPQILYSDLYEAIDAGDLKGAIWHLTYSCQ